ncbi:MAG TPA: hypothetical protein VMY39_00150, partial [Planctomycetota bacterium]|nr:hypothetical protein [Planctomycetota bacterium]
MRTRPAVMLTLLVAALAVASASSAADGFTRQWKHVGETSAVITWHLGDVKDAALSYVEYGKGPAPDMRTPLSTEPRWMQFHRLTALETGVPYSCRMVNVDPATKQETKSPAFVITPVKVEGAVYIGDEVQRPILLDKPGTTYVLTRDITAPGDAIQITAADVTLDLDGHTVTFGDDTDKQVFGVRFMGGGPAVLCNGHIRHGRRTGYYSACVESRRIQTPTEVFGISTDVRLKCTYPLRYFGGCANGHVHHNDLTSHVTELESRHYPGNHLMRVDINGGNMNIHDNRLTEGCHWGIGLSGSGPNVEVSYNDVRHHQQYVNGYAFGISCGGADVHHNKVTSSGRGAHLTGADLKFHDNYLDTYGHQQLDDIPAKSRPFKHNSVELHGIKFEGERAKNCKVYNNFMRITQKQPVDSQGAGDPDDKIHNGVYLRSKATEVEPDRLTDATQNWERDRWQNYWLKYDPRKPAVRITGNSATALFAAVGEDVNPGEYTIYQKWTYVPATPLNVACYDPNAMNDVHNNTFIALTTYRDTRHGGYG